MDRIYAPREQRRKRYLSPRLTLILGEEPRFTIDAGDAAPDEILDIQAVAIAAQVHWHRVLNRRRRERAALRGVA